MKEYQSFSHTRWDCKYSVVFIPKKRRKRIFGMLRKHLGEIFHELAVSNVMGYINGKSAIAIARRFGGRVKNFTGEVFWARGYFVSTVELGEGVVRAYIPALQEVI